MEHKKMKELLTLYFEGELEGKEKKLAENHLAACPECAAEFDRMNKLEEVMMKVKLKGPPEEVWKTYWTSVYNRLERRVGWILLSIGAMILLFFGGYKMLEGIVTDASTPLFLKVGILVFLGGIVVLLVSVLREQLFVRKRERYKEVEK